MTPSQIQERVAITWTGLHSALLSNATENPPPPVPPLPKLQIGILLLLQLAEPITSHCIYPFINQLVSELDITGGDEKKVGYCAGLIESLFFASEAPFVLQCLSMIFFGLAETFLGLVVSRCLVGMLNGNMGVIKSMMGELTDSTNMAQGFAMMPVVWSVGATVGPFIGGTLSKPHERPISAIFQTVRKRSWSECTSSEATIVEGQDDPLEEPATLRSLLVWPVLLSVANFALLESGYRALQPLFYSTPIALGGLGLKPASIGMAGGAFGLIGVFLRAHRTAVGMASFLPLFTLFPVINALARHAGRTPLVWAAVTLQLAVSVIMDMSYGCVFIFITSCAPNKYSLGATNGIAQLAAAVVRALGPASATSLFALSLSHNWAGGYGVYGILVAFSRVLFFVCVPLPDEAWKKHE